MRNWVPNNQLLNKFADFPLVTLDLYGRERHPEWSEGEDRDIEDYASRHDRAELMMKSLSYVPDGIPPATRFVLIDVDSVNLVGRVHKVTALTGGRAQSSMIIDLNGKVIQTLVWQDMAKNDEVLSGIFGLTPGGFTARD